MIKKKKYFSTKFILNIIFKILPLLITLIWIIFLLIKFPLNNLKTTNLIPNDLIININVRKINESGEFFIEREINLSETVAYVDMWRSHWCTYYNDREFYFTPRINEILQRLRQYFVKVIHISLSVDADLPMIRQRRLGLKAIEKGNLSILENFHARAMRYHEEYIPGFQDECVYEDQERFGSTRDNRFTKSITISTEDLFVSNFKESAMSFVGLGAKTILIFGQHTNMCLMAVFLYCKEVGLDLILIRDLTDSCWLYKYQKNHVNSHTKGNLAVNNYFDKEFGSSILSFDLIKSLKKLKINKFKQNYNLFIKNSIIFKNL